MRGSLRTALLLIFTALTLGVFAPAASAHAAVVRSQPADGANVAAAPDRVVLWFNEEIAPTFSSARLVDEQGLSVAGSRVLVGSDPQVLELQLPALEPGSYGVLWQVLAQGDGHTTNGVEVFRVGPPGASGTIPVLQSSTAAAPLDVALRWLGYCLLAGVVGGLAVAVLVLGRVRVSRLDRDVARAIHGARYRVLTMAWICAAVGAVTAVATPFRVAVGLAGATQGGTPAALAQILSATRWGHLWQAREVVILALMVVALVMRSRIGDDTRGRLSIWQIGAGALVLTLAGIEALVSHAAALDAGREAALVADSVHVLAALLWMGALPALILVLWRRGGAHDGRAALIRVVGRPFTRLAVVSVGLIVLTGLYSAGREVETVRDLFATTYGRMLLVKTALFLVIGGLGLLNSLRLRGGRASRRLIVVELSVGTLLLVAAGVLTSNPPPRGPVRTLAPPATDTISRSVDDLLVTVSVNPNRPGVNGFTVLAASSRRPPPSAIDDVTLRLVGSGGDAAVALHEVQPGRYFGTASLDSSGRARLTAIVQRGGERITFPLAWTVADPAPARFVQRSGRRLGPIVDALAWLLLLAALTAVGAWAWVRRRRHGVALSIGNLVVEREMERVP